MMRKKQISSIAIISEDVGHLTGGRYYVYFLGCALVEAGYNVTIYTNQKAVFSDYFKRYQLPEIKLTHGTAMDLRNFDVKADLYIGSPINGCIAAHRLGLKYKKPAYAIIFDPIPMIEHYKKTTVPSSSWRLLKEEISGEHTKIISLCEEPSKWIYEWLNKDPQQVIPIYPCVNSRERDAVRSPTVLKRATTRKPYVVWISRIVGHKRLDHALYACKVNKVQMKIISSVDGVNARRMVRQQGMTNMVEFHSKISDSEKFKIIYGASALLNSSVFEGFGIPTAEALSCGVPVVAYEYPTTREIADVTHTKDIYFAKYKDYKDLSVQLGLALTDNRRRKRVNAFDFDKLVERVKTL